MRGPCRGDYGVHRHLEIRQEDCFRLRPTTGRQRRTDQARIKKRIRSRGNRDLVLARFVHHDQRDAGRGLRQGDKSRDVDPGDEQRRQKDQR